MAEVKIILGNKKISDVVKLFEEYKAELNVDLSFQPSDDSVESILERYNEPEGKIFLATVDEKVAGCVAFHKMESASSCELKRLFVRPEYRGLKIGNKLLEKAINEAKKIGYEKIFLDTLSTLKSACKLYEKFGFEKIDAYYENPLENVVYYKLELKIFI